MELLDGPAAAVVTLSGGGATLRAWAAADGALLWEQQLSPRSSSSGGGSGGGGSDAGGIARTFSLEEAEAAVRAARMSVRQGADLLADDGSAADVAAAVVQATSAQATKQQQGPIASRYTALELLPPGGGRAAPLLVIYAAGHIYVRSSRFFLCDRVCAPKQGLSLRAS